MTKHVMVTGGTGFIGHNVVLDLLDWTDWRFTVVDAHTYAGLPEKLTGDPRFDATRVKVLTHDLTTSLWRSETLSYRQVKDLQNDPPDVVFNIASNSHVDNSIVEPVSFIKDNVALAVTMLEFARSINPSLFIQFSTDEVYGAAPIGLDFAEWSTILPSNPYSASKAAQEAIAISYWRTYGVPLVITNTMNVLGKRQHPEKFIPKIVHHLLRGEAVPVHAEFRNDHDPTFCVLCKEKAWGTQAPNHSLGSWTAGSRFYTYVSNISSALMFLTNRNQVHGPVLYPDSDRPERYNIVGDREVSNAEMVDLVATILDVEPLKDYVDFHSARPGHDRRYALSGSLLRSLGWKPPVSFEEGLKITVESARQEIEENV